MINERRDLTGTLLKLVQSGNATSVRGPVVRLNGQTCQEWRVQFVHPDKNAGDQSTLGSKKMSYSICLDTKTHLPCQIVMVECSLPITRGMCPMRSRRPR
jgi:hypothetical protein